MSYVNNQSLREAVELPESESDYDLMPSWLLSMVLHLFLVVLLGVFTIGGDTDSYLELVLSPQVADDEPFSLGEAIDLDVISEDELPASEITELPLEIDEEPIVSVDQTLTGELEAQMYQSPAGLMASLGHLSNGSGSPGYTSLFGLSAEGSKFMYVFDRSDSMNSIFTMYRGSRPISKVTPLELAKAELIRSLGELRDYHQFQIIFYNHWPALFEEERKHKGLLNATEENKHKAARFIDYMPGEGNTNHWLALNKAMELKPEVIFLLTDGQAKDDPPLYMIETMVKHCRSSGIQVNIVHFSDRNRPGCTLIQLAEETGGMHRFISLKTLAQAGL